MRFREMIVQLHQDGYRSARPSIEDAMADEALASRLRCRSCGRLGLTYRPYVRFARDGAGGRYRALAICPDCGDVEEL
jgi:hypothetical protein